MVFDGNLTISEKDFKLFYEVPMIITGNLTVGGNLTELFNFGTLMVFGDLYTTSLYSWESTLYVQGTLFAKQAVILSSGDYISQINSIKTPLLIHDGDNTILGSNADIFIDRSGNYQDSDDWNATIPESILEEYYTFSRDEKYQEDNYDLDWDKIKDALKTGKTILKINNN